jgi:hypothetical protein
MYVQFKIQQMYFFMHSLLFFILSSTCIGCYLHPSSGAQLQRTAIGVCMVLQVLVGTPSHFQHGQFLKLTVLKV